MTQDICPEVNTINFDWIFSQMIQPHLGLSSAFSIPIFPRFHLGLRHGGQVIERFDGFTVVFYIDFYRHFVIRLTIPEIPFSDPDRGQTSP